MDLSSWLLDQRHAVLKDVSRDELNDYWEDCRERGVYPYKAFDLKPWGEEIAPPVPAKGYKVQLCKFEIASCLMIGPKRTQAARKAGVKNMIQDGTPGSERERFIEQNGIAGELAFGKLFNVFPTSQISVAARKVKDDDGDFILDGLTVDVKTTEYPSGKLTLAPWKNNDTFFDRVQVMTLMTGDIRDAESRRDASLPRGQYVWHGFMSSRDLATGQRFKFLPGRDKQEYIARQDELTGTLEGWPHHASSL